MRDPSDYWTEWAARLAELGAEVNQREALDRATGPAITVEDVIIHKLLAWRPRDRDDIASILAAGHALDEAHIDRWTAAWDVADRWVEARQ